MHRTAFGEDELVLYSVANGGHTWPGGPQYAPVRFIGHTSRDIDASEAVWSFFATHRATAQGS